MLIHAFYNLIMFWGVILRPKATFGLILFTYPLFLLFLPDTGADFSLYEMAYDSLSFDINATFFYSGGNEITAEFGWKLYNAFIKKITGASFRGFLIYNFLICIVILLAMFKKFNISNKKIYLMIVFMLPTVFPVVFFWSPRSAISLCFALYGIVELWNGRKIRAAIVMLLCISVHSQYIVICFFAMFFIFIYKVNFISEKFKPLFSVIPLLFVALLINFRNELAGLISFIPNANIIVGKLHYFDDAEAGFRLSSILSILLFPLIYFSISDRLGRHKDLIFMFVLFGCAINLMFINIPHISGRLSRASDYFLIAFLTGYFLTSKLKVYNRLFAGSFIMLVGPFLYPSLYGFL